MALEGEFVECGVYRGGTAALLAELLSRSRSNRHLHLFDTFAGMPDVTEVDLHRRGDFAGTDLQAVKRRVGHSRMVTYHAGLIPDTFGEIQDIRVAFAHVDVDIFQSVMDCCTFLYSRLVPGAVIVFDDYGFASCPGARRAVDQFFRDKPEKPLVLSTGQAVLFRLPERPASIA